MERSKIINFGAGPSALPLGVLEDAAKGLVNYKGMGMGITELSHRSKEFGQLLTTLSDNIRELLDVPPTHSILFMQGGATMQFSAVVLNLLARHKLLYPELPPEDVVMDYVVTGSWSKKAADEARRLAGGAHVNVVVDGKAHSAAHLYDSIPPHSTWSLSARPAFVYYCENETVEGVQFSHLPDAPAAFPYHLLEEGGRSKFTPLVADYSSSFLSRPIHNIADHALIYAGAQKNVGPAGLTIVIVRQDLLVDTDAAARLGAAPVPLMLSYKTLAGSGSLHNTPPMFSMYVSSLVVAHIKAAGGLSRLEQMNQTKQGMLYAAIEEGEEAGIFKLRAAKGSRSWMNCTFSVLGEGREQKFLEGATERGLLQLKGHRSTGGVRVSLYNAITLEDVAVLVAYIQKFLADETTAKVAGMPHVEAAVTAPPAHAAAVPGPPSHVEAAPAPAA